MMKERIRELAIRAGDDWDHTLESDKEFLKKFAELIVKECAEVSKNYAAGSIPVSISLAIKEHFGVE